jgi:hypothetical protein
VTFRDSTSAVNLAVTEATNILSSYNWVGFFPSTAQWTFTDTGFTWNGNIVMSNFVISNTAFDLVNNSTKTLNSSGITLDGNSQSLKVVVTFSYTARTGLNTYPNGIGTIVLFPNMLKFNKIENKATDGVHTVSGSLGVNFNSTVALVTGSPIDARLQGYLASALVGNFDNYIKAINNDLTAAVNALYDAQSKGKTTSAPLETQSPDTNYTMSLNYLTDPSYTDKGVTYFFDGNVTKNANLTKPNGFLKEKNSIVKATPDFDPEDGSFQVFISYHVLFNILTDFSNSQSLTFAVNTANVPTNTFKLNIDFLAKIIPAVSNMYPLDQVVTLTAFADNYLNRGTNGDYRLGSCDITFKTLDSNNTSIFEFKTKVNFQLSTSSFDLISTAYNVKLVSLDVMDLTITMNTWGQANVDVLEGYVASGMSGYLETSNNWRLFKNDVIISKIIKEVSHFDDMENGVLFAGVPNSMSNIEKFEKILLNM